MANEPDSAGIVAATAERILKDLGNPAAINAAPDDRWKAPLWHALEDAGLTRAWIPAELGGAGATIADGFEIIRIAGRFAIAVPLAETMLAGWLLSSAGLAVPAGPITVAPTREADRIALSRLGRVTGHVRAVPFARDVAHFVVVADREDGGAAVALIDATAVAITDAVSISGDPAGNVHLDAVTPVVAGDAPADRNGIPLLLMGAAVRSVEMAGAMEAILDLTVRYANERVAFERPIAKFQAVQHNIARLAGEVAAALAASGSAADAIADAESLDDAVLLEVASAKIRVGEAAGEGASIAHQVHGAIGFTREHVLQRFTRRLWAWRDDFGSESQWGVRLGGIVSKQGADGLWPMLAAR